MYDRKFRIASRIILIFSVFSIAQATFAAEPVTVIRRPILNIPAIVQTGDGFEMICEAPASASGWNAKLLANGVEHTLSLGAANFDATAGRWTIAATVPAGLTPELYDLVVNASAGIADTAANAVKIVEQIKSSYTVAHITDSHFDRRANIDYNTLPENLKIIDEINLINPEFVLHTGDLADEGSQEKYFTVAQDAYRRLEVPIFITAGGHDVQIFHNRSEARELWETYFGDLMDFSFSYGDHFFAGLEEYEMPSESFRQDQLDWLSNALTLSKNRGDAMRVLFYHFDEQNQMTAAFAGANDLELLLYGHVHINREDILGTKTHNISTAPTMDGGFGQFLYKGEYRLLHFENDRLAWTKVLQYDNLDLSFSPVNNGLNPEVTATIVNNHDIDFPGALVRFFVPEGFGAYTVSGGTIAYERRVAADFISSRYHALRGNAVFDPDRSGPDEEGFNGIPATIRREAPQAAFQRETLERENSGVKLVAVRVDIPAQSMMAVTITPASGLANHPPQISTTSPEQQFSMKAGQSQTFAVTATDPENDALTFTWKLNGVADSSTGNAFTFSSNNSHVGLNTLEVVVSDGSFADVHAWNVTVQAQDLPYAIIAHPIGLVNPNAEFTLSWEEIISLDCYFRFGTAPGNYALGRVAEDGTSKSATFVPAEVGQGAPGFYYGVITSSPDANITADEYKSTEFRIIIESQGTAQVLGPKGTITEPTPLIQWQPVDGVPYYHLLFSDSPVTIGEDENGETVVQGANIIWQAITPNTSIRYGDPDPSGYFTFTNGTTPPLVNGLVYNYIVLNNYGNHPAFTSAVQGSINEFVVNIPTTLVTPHLQAPADSALLTGDEIIFRWDEVEGAVNYIISIFEQRTEDGSTVSYPVWKATTSNTLVDFPAGNYLINANYFWKVIAWDESGGGVQSPNFGFIYSTSVGTMYIRTLSSTGQLLTRVEVEVMPVEGSSDIIPIITNDHATFRKTLRDGTYDLTAQKEGYENETVRVVLPVDPYPNSTDGDYRVDILLEESPGSIAGRVYDPANGVGVPGAEVAAAHTVSGERRTATSDADGNFLLGVQSGDWEITAAKTGYVASAPQAVKVDPGASVNLGEHAIALELSSGTLSGTILTTTGKTLQGATIRAYSATDTAIAASASNGVYQMILTSGRWMVNAEKTGYVSPQPVEVAIARNGVTTVDRSLRPRANMISGYVRDGSRAIAEVTMTAVPLAGSPVTASTNNLGQYALSLASGTFALSASKPGYDGGDPLQITVTVAETVPGVNFTVTPNPSSISGRVSSDGMNGIAGAKVANGAESATANSSGAFTLSLPAGTHEIYAEKTGYATAEKQTISLAPGQSLTGIDFQLAPNAATISGAATGRGLALFQATVIASAGGKNYETQTDARGAFSLSLPPGAYTLQAKKEGYLDPAPKSITANPGQILAAVDFALVLNQATVSGIVRSASGELLRNVAIMAIADSNAAVSSTSTTNISGEFTMKLTAGARYKLKARKDGYSTGLADLGMLAASAEIFEDFTLTALPGSIAGTIRDQSGNPLAGSKVYAGKDTVVTDHLGAFTLYLATGSHRLGVYKPGYGNVAKTVMLDPGQHLTGVDFQLADHFASLMGTVQSSDIPVENALVNIHGGGNAATAQTTAQGKFFVEKLLPGAISMRISKDGFEQIVQAISLTENEQKNLTISLTPLTGTISGTVLADGKPLAGATVQASDGANAFTTISETQGRFEFKNLRIASYTLSAFRNGYSSPAALDNILIGSGGLQIALTPNTARFAGRVLYNQESVEGASIRVESAKGNTGSARSGTNGNFAIENLAADTYAIFVEKPGFKMADTSLAVVLAPGAQDSVDITMAALALRLGGRVLSAGAGQAGIPVEVRGGGVTLSFTTQGDGRFSADVFQPNTNYTIATTIFKPGYSEADTTVRVGISSLENIDLHIEISLGEISGSVGVQGASITATHESGRSFSAISNSNGRFEITRLPAGNFVTTAHRSGYVATPASQTVLLPVSGHAEANFELRPNTGRIVGKVHSTEGRGLAGVVLTASGENLEPAVAASDANGQFSFAGLPAGITYTVAASLAGYSADPARHAIDLENAQTATADFVLRANTGTIRGRVVSHLETSGRVIANALVMLENKDSGEGANTRSDTQGQYAFPPLPAGVYRLNASKGGYQAAQKDVEANLIEGGVLDIELALQSETGKLIGKINYHGRGIRGTQIAVSGPTRAEVETGADGSFTFPALPAGVYEVHAFKSGFPPISLPDVEIEKGGEQYLPLDFPGGQITWRLSDGVNPLPEVKATVTAPEVQTVVISEAGREIFRGEVRDAETGNAALQFMSDAMGEILTDSLRLAGTYRMALEKAGYLLPKAEHLDVELGIDEFKTVPVPLVFQHSPVYSASSRDSVRILLRYTDGLPKSRVQNPTLWVRRIGAETYVAKSMQETAEGYISWIAPHSQSGEAAYFLAADYQNNREMWHFASVPQTLRLDARGILYTIGINHSGATIQRGARLKLNVWPVDDRDATLYQQVLERGNVQWELVSGDSSATLSIDSLDPFKAELIPQIDGRIQIRISMTLGGLTKKREVFFSSQTMEIASIDIQAPAQAANNAPLNLRFVAQNNASQAMLLDSEWRVEPAQAGVIDENGVFTPSTDFLGDATIKLVDLTSGFEQSAVINLFATVDSTTERTFQDATGMRLQLEKNAVARRRQISLSRKSRDTLPDVKKFTRDYQVAGQVYEFLPTGLIFEKPPQVTLPLAKSRTGANPTLGRWEQTTLSWQPLASTPDDSAVSAFLDKFAQLAVLYENRPLGIHNLSFLPTPFSPKRGPMRIGYVLTGAEGRAKISIRIYNMAGDLVRILADRKVQFPGAHTEADIAWDGLTDGNEFARNGRYIVEVIAEDVRGSVRELATVVLVK